MNFKVGDLVTLKSPNEIAEKNVGDIYDPTDWVGIIVEITDIEKSPQVEIWKTCRVMWRGRKAVSEFLDNLELVGEAR